MTMTSTQQLDLSDLHGCGGELRYLQLIVRLTSAASSLRAQGRDVTLAALADECEQPSVPAEAVKLSPRFSNVLALPVTPRLAHVPATLRTLADDKDLCARVDKALARVEYDDDFAVQVEDALIEPRDTVFDRLTLALLDAR